MRTSIKLVTKKRASVVGVEKLKTKRIKGNSLLEAVCKSVHERRDQLRISQEELASRAGLHRTYISDIERGARNPSLKTLCRLAEALELTTSDLIKLGEAKAANEVVGSTGGAEIAVDVDSPPNIETDSNAAAFN